MWNLILNSYDSISLALALVRHVWKHIDLRKVTYRCISVSEHIMKIDSHEYIMFFFHIQYFIGRHRYPLVDCWWYHYSSTSSFSSHFYINNRQLIVLFSAGHWKPLPPSLQQPFQQNLHQPKSELLNCQLIVTICSLPSYCHYHP